SQITTPVTSRPGAASSRVKRMTRRSKRVRRIFFRRRCAFSFTTGREPIFFHPPVQCATAEAQRLRNLADIALEALERLADQNTSHGFQTQFFEVLRGRSLTAEAQIGGLQQIGAAHQYSALNRVFEFANIPRPHILQQGLQRRWVQSLDRSAIASGVPYQKV